MVDTIKNKDRLIEKLEGAVDTEYTTSLCYNHLATLTKNGRIRKNFISFSDSAKINEGLLKGRLNNLGIRDFVLEEKCNFCKINPQSFSLIGAINLGLEVINIGIKFYKDLLGLSNNVEDRKLFRKLLNEKIRQRRLLRQERKFSHKKEEENSFIDNYCIPDVISKLWK